MHVMADICRLGAQRYEDKPAVRFGDEQLTYRDLENQAHALAAQLSAHGVRTGDAVALLAENAAAYPIAVFAVLKLGAVVLPLNFRFRPAEVAYILNDSKPRLLLYGVGYEDLAHQAQAECTTPVQCQLLDSIIGTAMGQPTTATFPEVSSDAAAMIMYTSGTTGFPKGVRMSHRAYLAGILSMAFSGGLSEEDRVLVGLPLFHNGGLNGLLMPALAVGATCVITSKGFRAEQVLEVVQRDRISLTMWVPTMLSMLVHSPQFDQFDLSSVRRIWYGSSSITPELLAKVRRSFPRAGLVQFYGMAEIGMTAVLRPSEHREWSHCTGREMWHAEMRIVDERFRDVEVGEVGEIVSKQHPFGMLGYVNNDEATRQIVVDGWICTGDIARSEGHGLFTIVDRKKDVIISGAENIYPQEIEATLGSHPCVLEAAVFGIPDPVFGEAVCASVVCRPGHELTADELRDWCGSRLASYKKPKVVDFVADLPRNASGKVTKNVLRAPFWSGRERNV